MQKMLSAEEVKAKLLEHFPFVTLTPVAPKDENGELMPGYDGWFTFYCSEHNSLEGPAPRNKRGRATLFLVDNGGNRLISERELADMIPEGLGNFYWFKAHDAAVSEDVWRLKRVKYEDGRSVRHATGPRSGTLVSPAWIGAFELGIITHEPSLVKKEAA